ncbi:MAG: acetyl-CoA synthase subunit gamma [Deltaproteobacteria bacterium]|nr:acetyl-CoA synthase subunit gamma [Deltaproteobacteria bacterium]
MAQLFVTGSIDTAKGPVPLVSSCLAWSDRWGDIKARWNVGRMNHKVVPGLYALGTPDDQSLVLVTANYKMSFNRLREALPGRSAWILALDTDGVNVWCAAGKGTFGTEELVRRLEACGLDRVVSHRKLILPQLSAPGIDAHQVKRLAGFRVVYGPVQAGDLPFFIDAGFKATPEMRRKTFTARERAVLIPVELVSALKWGTVLSVAFSLAAGFLTSGNFLSGALPYGFFAALALMTAVIAGAVVTPLLLPWLPGRAFALKGAVTGFMAAGILAFARNGSPGFGHPESIAWFFLIPALSAFLAMNFTGASTYTSLSGVRKEMRLAVPLEISAGIIGICLWVRAFFIA